VKQNTLIHNYVEGPIQLRKAIAGMSDQQIDAAPIMGKWSTRQVICHIADFELVSADRIKRVLVDDNPTLLDCDPDQYANRLQYVDRIVEEEMDLISSIRLHVSAILRALEPEAFQRIGTHSAEGPMTLAALVERTTRHISHHIKFIEDKKAAMKV